MEPLHTFATGAKRSKLKPPYYLITQSFLERVAGVLDKGQKSYGPNNWVKGDQSFAMDTLNHLFEHVIKLLNGDKSEDHLGHAACNLMFLDKFTREHPEWFEDEYVAGSEDALTNLEVAMGKAASANPLAYPTYGGPSRW